MNDNYMKTILSGVKEWTENLTDDKANNAIDKANNAFEQANNALDKANNALGKALFVVNITTTDGVTISADKTFDEIIQAYNEKKYNIVADAGSSRMPFLAIRESQGFEAIFGGAINNGVDSITITDKNEIKFSHLTLATTKYKLPNPYALTFTGAVTGSYDGSSAKTIEIPIGADGITPTIGENGNWYLGATDTGKPSRGEKGETGARGEKGDTGATGATGATGQSAYAAAQAGGYTDTEANFYADLAAMQGLASALAAI